MMSHRLGLCPQRCESLQILHLKVGLPRLNAMPYVLTFIIRKVPQKLQVSQDMTICELYLTISCRMKRNPRKVRWTKAFRKAHGKEMTIVSLVHLSRCPHISDCFMSTRTRHSNSRSAEMFRSATTANFSRPRSRR